MFKENPTESEYARSEYARAIARLAEKGFSELKKSESASAYARLLGSPLDCESSSPTALSQEYVGSDELCEIFRLRITVLPELPFFGLMFVPKGKSGSLPLCIAAHGHLGTPELMYGMHGKNGYSDIIGRLLERGFCVFAPQFLIWNYGFAPAKPHYGTSYDRRTLDEKLKAQGGGICALELFCLLRSITALSAIKALDISNLCACGMSYGAFYTMRAMALDERIRRGYFMSCFDGGLNEDFPEWFVREKKKTPRDGEVAAMCAPRPILIETGERDEIFPPEGAKYESVTAYHTYKSQNAKDSFNFRIWSGGHIVCPDNYGVDFLQNNEMR